MSVGPAPELIERRGGPRVGFLAVGHAGGRLIGHLPERVPELIYAAMDTDQESLGASPFATTFLIGRQQTGGLGSGSNPDLARECAAADAELWEPWLEQLDVVLIVCGLGGGTGGGVSPLVAQRGKELGKRVIAIAVQPLGVEGGHRRHVADAALAMLRDHSDAVCLFSLDVMAQHEDAEALPLPKLIALCAQEIGRSLGGLALLLRGGMMIPLTLQDLVQVMQRADGYCRLAAVSAQGEDRITDALDSLFTHPLLDRGSLLAQSGGLLVGILAGPQTTVRELEAISGEIRSVLRADVELKLGVALDDRFAKRVAIVMMVAERWSTTAVSLSVASEISLDEGIPETELNLVGGSQLVQDEIALEGVSKGRFKDVEPTIVQGADLDTPTFIRLGIRLSTGNPVGRKR